jgi:hypothetical protein
MGIQKIIKREDIIVGDYIPTEGVPNKVWSTDGAGAPDWRDNPALVSPTTTKGDIIVHGASNEESLSVGQDGYELVADSTTATGLAWKYKGNLQKEVTDPTYTVANEDDSYTIFFNSPNPIAVTIDDVTLANLEVDFYNLGAGAVTFVQGTAVLGMPDGSTLVQDKVCALIKFLDNNIYKLKGELI